MEVVGAEILIHGSVCEQVGAGGKDARANGHDRHVSAAPGRGGGRLWSGPGALGAPRNSHTVRAGRVWEVAVGTDAATATIAFLGPRRALMRWNWAWR